MIKLVFITAGLSTGGAEMMLLKLLQYIDRITFDISVISLSTEEEIGTHIKKLNIPVYSCNMKSYRVFFSFFMLVKLLKTIKPDIVQTWMYHADLIGGITARFAGVSNIVWGIRNSNSKLVKKSTKVIIHICSVLSKILPKKILSCSEFARQVHSGIGYQKDKFYVIPNGFLIDTFKPDKDAKLSVYKELNLKEASRLVGLIGRFDPQKNHIGFIKSTVKINKYHPEVEFILAGKDINSENNILKNEIDKTGLNEKIHLLNIRTDMPRLMSSLDVLVSSSYGEAFPNVLGEAMACEVPCVVTDVGDSAYIVGDTGHVVSSGDMEGLADKVIELLSLSNEEYKSLGEKARARIINNFEIHKVTKLYEDFYKSLVK